MHELAVCYLINSVQMDACSCLTDLILERSTQQVSLDVAHYN